mmetsp:Transcript_11155/g.31664  ORF Transcript_11155/g.31664 Transcript_11155/m.31664 type:complete len:366 (+) Transcript_11155:832-1929(+)
MDDVHVERHDHRHALQQHRVLHEEAAEHGSDLARVGPRLDLDDEARVRAGADGGAQDLFEERSVRPVLEREGADLVERELRDRKKGVGVVRIVCEAAQIAVVAEHEAAVKCQGNVALAVVDARGPGLLVGGERVLQRAVQLVGRAVEATVGHELALEAQVEALDKHAKAAKGALRLAAAAAVGTAHRAALVRARVALGQGRVLRGRGLFVARGGRVGRDLDVARELRGDVRVARDDLAHELAQLVGEVGTDRVGHGGAGDVHVELERGVRADVLFELLGKFAQGFDVEEAKAATLLEERDDHGLELEGVLNLDIGLNDGLVAAVHELAVGEGLGVAAVDGLAQARQLEVDARSESVGGAAAEELA